MRQLITVLIFVISTFAQGGMMPGPGMVHTIAGTFTLVQTKHCSTAASSNTCSIVVSPSLAAGNLDIFGCNVQNNGFPNNSIASVSAGGTLIQTIGASTGAYGFSAVLVAPMSAYILPSTSTGGVSPIVVTFRVNASNPQGGCDLQEWSPSSNGVGVALDTDSGFLPLTASTSNTNLNMTLSGTNDIVFQQVTPSSVNSTMSAVTSPYNTNQYFPATGTGGGFSGATTTGTGPTWTGGTSSIPVMTAFSFGWNTSPCSVQSLVDSEAGTNGNTVAVADLTNSTHGWQGALWVITGSLIKYDSTASMPLLNATGRLCDGTSYSAGTGSMGLSITGTGAGDNSHIVYGWGASGNQTVVTITAKWTSDVASNDSSNIDCLTIHGTSDYAAVNCYGSQPTRYFGLETPSGNGSFILVDPITSCGSIGCTLVVQYQAGTGSVSGTHSLKVYNSAGTLMGTSSHTGSTALDFPRSVQIGPSGTMTLTSGKKMKWDSLQISLGSTVPNM